MIPRMSRTALTLSLMSLLTLALGAGPDSEARAAWRLLGGGAKGGVGFVQGDFQYTSNPLLDPSTSTRPGGYGFLILEWSRKARLRLQPEVGFMRRGYKADVTVDDVNTERSVSADYLSIPIMLRSEVAGDETILYVLFGPSLELLLSNDDDEVLNSYNSWTINGNASIGVEFPLAARISGVVEVRFNTEFTDAIEQTSEDLPRSVHHRTILITGGLRF